MTPYRLLLFLLFCVQTTVIAKPLQIVASFSILGDLIQQVGGDKVQVTTIVGPNGDAHVYEPTPADVKNIAQTDMLFINGLGFEGWIERLIDGAGFKGDVVVTTAGIQPRIFDDNGAGKILDPHIWHDPLLVKQVVKNIVKALIKRDPANKRFYQQREKAYLQELAHLDCWITSQLKKIPLEKRKVITAHDAFGYFGKRYNINILSPVGISTEAEPTIQTVAGLVRLIRQLHILTIFLENITNAKMIEQIADETGARIGGTLFSDALSLPHEGGDTYIKLIQHNVTHFMQAMTELLSQ